MERAVRRVRLKIRGIMDGSEDSGGEVEGFSFSVEAMLGDDWRICDVYSQILGVF